MRFITTIALALVSATIYAGEVRGPAHVIDGDSIRIADTEIRLYGIDAPEAKQLCLVQGEDWECGQTATDAMKQIVGTAPIHCAWTQRDRYERALGTCTREGYDIAEMMVDFGVALAYTQYSGKYIPDEAEAKSKREGLWSAQFVPPWDWRRGVRLPGNELPDIECPVKGNVNSKGDRIYHVKGWRDHAKVRINRNQGDRCFQNVPDAISAGFRKPRYAAEEK